MFPDGGEAQFSEGEHCDYSDLTVCVGLIPRTKVGLPKTKEELDAHCQ